MLSGEALGRAAYAAWGQYGVPVFPCDDSKQPLCKWQQAASTDEEAITQMFASRGAKARLVGAVMGKQSGLFALDFDFYKGPEAQEFLDILLMSGCLPPTRVHQTMSGGLHYIYEVAEGDAFPHNSLPYKNVEIRGEGGYIIVPPSHGYKVQLEGIVTAPDALLRRLARAEKQFASLSVTGLTEMILSGASFHEALTSLAAKLHARGDTPAKVMEALNAALMGSVASNPMHERHERWKRVMEGKDGELARLNTSAFRKFNPRRNQMEVEAVAPQMQEARKKRDITIGGFFAMPPAEGSSEEGGTFTSESLDPEPATASGLIQQAANPDEFPFERSYNAAQVEEQDNKRFVIYPLVMESDVVVLSAEPKAGKTLTAMTLCLHAAAGIPFGDTLTPMNAQGEADKVPVIYFALEGQGAIRKRIKAWLHDQKTAHGRTLTMDDLRIYVVERPVNLTSDEAKQELVDKLMLAQAFFRRRGWGDIGITVFDTLTKAMPGKDQNSVEDTSAVFNTIDMMRDAKLNCAVMFIHHNNKQSKSPRGSSNILAEPDTILSAEKVDPIVIEGVQRNCVKLSVYMARAIDETQVYHMAMHEIEIGLNSQSIMERAPVLAMLDDYTTQETPTDTTLRKNTAAAKEHFYEALWEVLSAANGMTLPFGVLAKRIANANKSAGTYYNAHLNTNSKDGAKATWQALVANHSLPASLAGMTFTVNEETVTMQLDTASAVGQL